MFHVIRHRYRYAPAPQATATHTMATIRHPRLTIGLPICHRGPGLRTTTRSRSSPRSANSVRRAFSDRAARPSIIRTMRRPSVLRSGCATPAGWLPTEQARKSYGLGAPAPGQRPASASPFVCPSSNVPTRSTGPEEVRPSIRRGRPVRSPVAAACHAYERRTPRHAADPPCQSPRTPRSRGRESLVA